MISQAVDIHTHIVPAEFPAYAGNNRTEFGGKQWPQMAMGCDCHHKNVMIDGKNFRTVTDECWDIGRRAEAMAQMNIARQVLSPMPELSVLLAAAGGRAAADPARQRHHRHDGGAGAGQVHRPRRRADAGPGRRGARTGKA